MTSSYQVGDVIEFRSPTRSHNKVALRKVVGVDRDGRPLVRYHGWSDFIVQLDEVIAHSPTGCSCMEVFGEDPACSRHGVDTEWGRANPEAVEP